MKVALVHDYLKEYGGAERVLEALHEMFPKAPVYVAFYAPKGLGIHAARFKDWDIRTSWLQKVPFAGRFLSPLRILAPTIFESFDLSEYEVVISSCAIYFSKAVITKPKTLHISYIHTPPRYLYGYTTSFNYKKRWWTRLGAEVMNHFLRIWDFETSQRPDILVANSENVAQRIKKFYRREATVVYPPVEVWRFSQLRGVGKGDYFLSVSRLWKGKGVDLVIEASIAAGVPLKVVGTGPELENLKRKTVSSGLIEFLGQIEDSDLPTIYSAAKALVVAAEDEDFGITVVEAQAAGTPVIALRAGGYLETVAEGKTGVFFDEPTVESLARVLQDFEPGRFQAQDCQKWAQHFSKERFKKDMLELIKKGA